MEEIWHWEKKSTNLFRPYIMSWLEKKLRASAFPANDEGLPLNAEQKQAYVDILNNEYGWTLEVKDIEDNPSMRALAKLLLNSFWGRFGMNANVAQTVTVGTTAELLTYVTDSALEVTSITEVNDDLNMICFRHRDQYIPIVANLNIVVAVMTTAQARVALYQFAAMIPNLKSRLLYFDTDSIIYLAKVGEKDPIPESILMGGMKDELGGRGCCEFFSTGPKCYGLKVEERDGSYAWSVLKCKGVSLNHLSLQKLNADTMIAALHKEEEKEEPPAVIEIVQPHRIRRNKALVKLYSKTITKRWKVLVTKRVRIGLETVPFGYRPPPPVAKRSGGPVGEEPLTKRLCAHEDPADKVLTRKRRGGPVEEEPLTKR